MVNKLFLIKLIDIIPSTRKDKKLMAIFDIGDKIIKTHFGSKFSETFLDHKNPLKKANYIKRHKALGTENYNSPITASSLSLNILWNKPTFEESLEDFKKKFNL